MSTFTIRIGMLSPPLQTQLAEQGMVLKDAKHWERRVKAIAELRVLGIITDAESRKAEKRFVDKLRCDVRLLEPTK